MLNNLTQSHEYPGKLFVVEGIDGSGKTTQLALLAKWLSAAGHRVFVTEWNSSALVKAATKSGKKKNSLTPMTFSLLHATDFADRLLYKVIPPLKAGMIVLADRYAYTAFARDATRGVDRQWVRELYSFAVRPDLALYFRVPIEVSLQRLLTGRTKLKYHEAGMDVGLATDPVDSYRLFQSRVLDNYDKVTAEFGLRVIDAAADIPSQQKTVRREAEAMVVAEPALASFVYGAVLAHASLDDVVIHRVGAVLGHAEVPADILCRTYEHALVDDPTIGARFRSRDGCKKTGGSTTHDNDTSRSHGAENSSIQLDCRARVEPVRRTIPMGCEQPRPGGTS